MLHVNYGILNVQITILLSHKPSIFQFHPLGVIILELQNTFLSIQFILIYLTNSFKTILSTF